MELATRPANLEDVETLIALMTEFYGESGFAFETEEARAGFRRLLEDPRLGASGLLLADREVAGYFVMTFGFSMTFGGAVVTLDDLFVRPAFRGRGLGRVALTELRMRAEALGVRALHLEVDPENAAALALYRKAGFEERPMRSMVLPLEPPLHERGSG